MHLRHSLYSCFLLQQHMLGQRPESRLQCFFPPTANVLCEVYRYTYISNAMTGIENAMQVHMTEGHLGMMTLVTMPFKLTWSTCKLMLKSL